MSAINSSTWSPIDLKLTVPMVIELLKKHQPSGSKKFSSISPTDYDHISAVSEPLQLNVNYENTNGSWTVRTEIWYKINFDNKTGSGRVFQQNSSGFNDLFTVYCAGNGANVPASALEITGCCI